jgi:predicted methyltransferase
MRYPRIAGLALIVAAAAVPVAGIAAPPAKVTAAVASSTRTADNVKLDESRKPAQLLRFLGLRSGMRVLDMVGGNKYWAEIIAPAVGPKGHVTVWQPTQFLNDERKKTFEAFAAAQKNVSFLSSPFEAPSLPKNAFDFAIINLDYHDVYWESTERKIPRMDPDAWLKTFYAAMKPGAVVGIVDHAAKPGGNTREVVDKLHRIDPKVVLADFRRAGFQLVGSSAMYRNPGDDHSLPVFDPKIRGKTDRFVYKFRKPAR